MRLSDESHLMISDLAEKLGITTRTIRLYEKLGLANAPKRTVGKVRYYEADDIIRFKMLLRLKALGLSLEEMKELADLFDREEKTPIKIMPRLIELLETHLVAIREKVETLQKLESDIAAYRMRIITQYKLGK
ncbi:MAG: MerR family transcriptional regulator [Spirochaetota bacterium]